MSPKTGTECWIEHSKTSPKTGTGIRIECIHKVLDRAFKDEPQNGDIKLDRTFKDKSQNGDGKSDRVYSQGKLLNPLFNYPTSYVDAYCMIVCLRKIRQHFPSAPNYIYIYIYIYIYTRGAKRK
jgi:hypothetical protein